MPPDNATAVAIFFLLVAPGIVFQMLRERRRPAFTESALREIGRIVLASTVFTLTALLILGLVRVVWPSSMPDPGVWLQHGTSYVRIHYRLVARALLLEILIAVVISALVSLWMGRRAEGRIERVSAWFRLFRSEVPQDSVPYVRLQLKSGEVYGGYVANYSEQMALDEREIVLRSPISYRSADGETEALDDAWQRVIIGSTEIASMRVSYVKSLTLIEEEPPLEEP